MYDSLESDLIFEGWPLIRFCVPKLWFEFSLRLRVGLVDFWMELDLEPIIALGYII